MATGQGHTESVPHAISPACDERCGNSRAPAGSDLAPLYGTPIIAWFGTGESLDAIVARAALPISVKTHGVIFGGSMFSIARRDRPHVETCFGERAAVEIYLDLCAWLSAPSDASLGADTAAVAS